MKDLFPIPLLHEKITLQKSDLYNQIKEARAKKDPGRHGYTSYFDKGKEMEGVDWSELKEKIYSSSKAYYSTVIPQGKWPKVKIHAWWNLYGADNHHCWHAHSNALFAGSYYVYMDELSVPIEFKNPLESLIYSWHPKFGLGTRWAQNLSLTTTTSDLLMWPAWMDHSVPKQSDLSHNLRCTISFNVIIDSVSGRYY